MRYTFISNCEHVALLRTRKILDKYAQRIGARAWALRGPETVVAKIQTELTKAAKEETSVTCYKSDGASTPVIVWVVGEHKSCTVHSRFSPITLCPRQ